ncbi:MAG: serine hydrolase domain-containing protein [Isosphaeraceae bacterium]
MKPVSRPVPSPRRTPAFAPLVLLGFILVPAGASGDEPPQNLRPGDPHAHGLADADLNAIRAILKGSVESKTVPGISLLLAHRGEVIFREAYGNLTVDSKAQMASSSKPVTATLLMILVDQGKLSLDDPVEKHLPEFQGIKLNGKPPARPPTVRDLLSNMSGLPGDLLTQSIMRRLRERAARAPVRPKGEEAGAAAAEVADAIEKGGRRRPEEGA